LFLIAEDLTKMQVDTSVAEADIGKLKAGMEATFTVDAFPAKVFKGSIRQIRNAPQTLQNVVTYDAVIDVANPNLELRPGMTANVVFIYDHRDSALRVPNAALRFKPPPEMARGPNGGGPPGGSKGERGPGGGGGEGRRSGQGGPRGGQETPDKRTLWVLRGGKASPLRVKVGVTDGTNTEIETSDLNEGDRVITDVDTGGEGKAQPPPGSGAFRRMF
jgi:HlyD family secretion protein